MRIALNADERDAPQNDLHKPVLRVCILLLPLFLQSDLPVTMSQVFSLYAPSAVYEFICWLDWKSSFRPQKLTPCAAVTLNSLAGHLHNSLWKYRPCPENS